MLFLMLLVLTSVDEYQLYDVSKWLYLMAVKRKNADIKLCIMDNLHQVRPMSKDPIHNKRMRSNHLAIHVHCNKNMCTV